MVNNKKGPSCFEEDIVFQSEDDAQKKEKHEKQKGGIARRSFLEALGGTVGFGLIAGGGMMLSGRKAFGEPQCGAGNEDFDCNSNPPNRDCSKKSQAHYYHSDLACGTRKQGVVYYQDIDCFVNNSGDNDCGLFNAVYYHTDDDCHLGGTDSDCPNKRSQSGGNHQDSDGSL